MSERVIFSDDELERLRNGQFLTDDIEESSGDDFMPEDEEPQSPGV
jgi:hypothetical protein